MVELPDFRAWQFQLGVERIRTAFRASITLLEEEERRALRDHADHLDLGLDERTHDDDGVLTRSTETELQFASIEAAFASQVVREAFTTSAFHYWERSAREWTRCPVRTDFARLAAAVIALGYPVSPEMSALNSLNNLIKHNNPDRGDEVFRSMPDLFLWGRRPSSDDWHAHLRLGTAEVERFIDAVARSGPRPTTERP